MADVQIKVTIKSDNSKASQKITFHASDFDAQTAAEATRILGRRAAVEFLEGM